MSSDYSLYPLTYPQKNIYKTEITYPGTPIGMITATMRIHDENIDFSIMEKALNLIVEHNDSLRIRVKLVDREPRQYFAEYQYEKYDIIDLRSEPIQKLYDFDREQTKEPMDLIESQLYRFTLLWISDNEFAVFLKIHHLISDGWSTVRIGNYILDYYEKLQKKIDISFEKIPSYKEYILNEADYLTSETFKKDKEFWRGKYKNTSEPSMIKTRKSKLVGIDAERRTFPLPDKLVVQLRQYCKDTRTSVFGVILSAFAIYLHRTTHRNDLTIGTLVLNRSNRRQKNTVGMFISTVPIKIDFEECMNFTEFNKLLTTEWMSVLKHQKYPFELLLKDIREKNKDSKDLFDIVFSYQNASFTENTSSKERSSRWHFNHSQKESLTIHVHDRDDFGKLLLDYDYLTDLFQEKEIEFIHDNFIRILWHALDDSTKPMTDLELISEKEKKRLLLEFNNSKLEYDDTQTIVDVIRKQVNKTPDKIALIQNDEKVTYRQLEDMSNSLANEIVSLGVNLEDIVCILADKSIKMIVSILAVLKAGCAYLCIEKDLPADRKKFMLNDSNSRIIIADKKSDINWDFDGDELYLNDESLFSKSSTKIQTELKATNLAYIIYTSGTIGEPKGVLIEHRSVVNYIYGFLNEFKYMGEEKVLQQSSYAFDAFVEEVYPTLASGASLVIANKYGAKDMRSLAKTINDNDISVVSVSPLVLNELNKMNCFDTVKLFISGGDVLEYDYMDNLIENADIYNTYGPTETTVCATYHKCIRHSDGNIPIGSPVSNYKLYILDRKLSLLPIGVPGDLYIAGPGLARGYLNRPELTAEMFIDNPFVQGEKMYKTNDIARWYPMGEIEHMGRNDRQVKIRGMRVELGEIESQLLKNPKINSVAVVVKKVDGSDFLCAYYETIGDITIQEIKTYLRKKLPQHMIPKYFLQMERLPLSNSGKVNLRELPSLENMVINEQNEYVKPSDETDEKLIEIIERILKKTKISMKDNFFEIGGDSLSLNTLVFDILDELGINVPLDKIFGAGDIEEISTVIKNGLAAANELDNIEMSKNIVQIHSGDVRKGDIFFVHDGIGGVGAYFDLSNYLDGYNVWGIRAEDIDGLAPNNTKIEEIAQEYALQIMRASNEPYIIAGWCIGGTIAFEIVRQLQSHGKKVKKLFLIDSIPPIEWENVNKFSLKGEKEFISDCFNYSNLLKGVFEAEDIDTLWEKAIERIEHSALKDEIIGGFIEKIPSDIRQYLDEYHALSAREIFQFINQVRTFHIARSLFFPKGILDVEVVFYQAEQGSVVINEKIWDDYFVSKVEYLKVSGDHNSMLKLPCVKEMAKDMLGRIVENES